MSLPARTRDYMGPVTDTRIWDGFALRPDDIVLSTPPKCGTTWSQAIIMMLIHGTAVSDRMVWRDSLWLDCGFRDQAELSAALGAQTHRRCIKSHTPFDGIPYRDNITYITVFRHPVDVHFSMMKHVENMKYDILDHLFPAEPGVAFTRFLDRPVCDEGTDDLSLAAILHHYRSFARWAHLPNVHIFHYADLSADLPGAIRAYAAALGIDASDALVGDIVKAASFGAMKSVTRAQSKQPHATQGAFHEEHKFFDSATSNKWEGRLSDAELARYRARINALATPDEIDFLENGARRD